MTANLPRQQAIAVFTSGAQAGQLTPEFYKALQALYKQSVTIINSSTVSQAQLEAMQQQITSLIANFGPILSTNGAGFLAKNGQSYNLRQITGTSGEIGVTGGDGSADVVISLATVTPTTGGALAKYGFDTFGRMYETAAATTSDLPEGTNHYFTNPRVGAAMAAGSGITLTTDPGTGITTVAVTAATLDNLTDQTGTLITDQLSVQLTSNSVSGAIPQLAAFTLTTLPSASVYQYGIIYVTNLTGSPAPCYSDGTNWRRFSDNSIAS